MHNFYRPAYDSAQTSPLAECASSEFCTLSAIGEGDPEVRAKVCKRAAMKILEETGEVSSCPQVVNTDLIRQQQEFLDVIEGIA